MNTTIEISNPATTKAYFEKVRQLAKSGEKYPIDLDEVWPLVYSKKSNAVEVLKKKYDENLDYRILLMSPQNSKRGRKAEVYRLSLSCMEHLIAREVRAVFDVYRQVFHQAVNEIEQSKKSESDQLSIFTERPKQIQNSKEVNSYNFSHGGKEQAIAYNRANCFLHTGKTPSELVEWAKRHKVPSKFRTSAKEVIRSFKPAVSSSMALADEFCKTGKIGIEESAAFCKTHALPVFQKMQEMGLLPTPSVPKLISPPKS